MMTIRRTSRLHDLIRGGDTWRHQLRMLLASLGFSLLFGLVIALAVVGIVFYYRTEPNFRAAIVSHAFQPALDPPFDDPCCEMRLNAGHLTLRSPICVTQEARISDIREN